MKDIMSLGKKKKKKLKANEQSPWEHVKRVVQCLLRIGYVQVQFHMFTAAHTVSTYLCKLPYLL